MAISVANHLCQGSVGSLSVSVRHSARGRERSAGDRDICNDVDIMKGTGAFTNHTRRLVFSRKSSASRTIDHTII